MLYWAEGAKRRNTLILTNADADLLELFVRFLRFCYGVDDDQLRFSVNCFVDNGLTVDQIEAVVAGSARIARVLPQEGGGQSRLLGVAAAQGPCTSLRHRRVAVNSTFVVQSIYGAIQEYAGIDRPEWLDL